jgi:hypothetical protein
MTDFVTRLESELRAAALRHEGAGAVRRVALPRMRTAVRALPAAAAAAALLAVTLVGIGILLSSSPERAGHLGVPPVLRGVWQAPPTELRLFTAGSQRCAKLGVGSSDPCYTLGASATGVAVEWGQLSVSDDELTLAAMQDSRPGVYRWSIERGTLRLAKVRDPLSRRATALVTTPLEQARTGSGRAELPYDWLKWAFTSRRFGYSIRLPHPWERDSIRTSDRFSPAPFGSSSTSVTISAQDVAAGMSGARWGVIVDSRSEAAGCAPYDYHRFVVDGVKFRVSVYMACRGAMLQTASFVHAGRGYVVTWRGPATRPERDRPRFGAMLKSIVFLR